MISYAIQHHPDRAELLYRFAGLNPEIVTDPEPEHRTRNPWRTYLECIRRTPEECSHRVILQDDATLCPNFHRVLTEALSVKPDSLIALFVPTTLPQGSRRLMEACGEGKAWCQLLAHEWVPVVGVVWPVRLVKPFEEWAVRCGFEGKFKADDALVGMFARAFGESVYATVPSLVQHEDDQPSLIGLRTRAPRQAMCFAGHHAAQIDWSRV